MVRLTRLSRDHALPACPSVPPCPSLLPAAPSLPARLATASIPPGTWPRMCGHACDLSLADMTVVASIAGAGPRRTVSGRISEGLNQRSKPSSSTTSLVGARPEELVRQCRFREDMARITLLDSPGRWCLRRGPSGILVTSLPINQGQDLGAAGPGRSSPFQGRSLEGLQRGPERRACLGPADRRHVSRVTVWQAPRSAAFVRGAGSWAWGRRLRPTWPPHISAGRPRSMSSTSRVSSHVSPTGRLGHGRG